MNKFKTDIKYRIAAVVLAVLFGTLAATSGLVATFTYEMGLYTQSLDSVIKNKQEIVQEMASMQIFQHREKIKNGQWTLPYSNIEYGIIQADNLENTDLADKSIYWDYHFHSTKPSQNSYVSQRMNEEDEFEYTNRLVPSLTGYNLLHFSTEDSMTTYASGVMPVRHIDYCPDDGIFYFTTDSHSYSVSTIGIKSTDAIPTDDMLAKQKKGLKIPEETYPEECIEDSIWSSNLVFFQLNHATGKYVSISGNYQDLDTGNYKQWKTLYLDTFSCGTFSILQKKSAELLPRDTDNITTSLISTEEVIHYTANDEDSDRALMELEANAKGLARYTLRQEHHTYWVISQVKPRNEWVTKDDLIAKQYYTLTSLYNYRYLSLAAAVIASILALLAAAFCIWSAGYRQVQEDDDRDFCGKRHNILLTWRQRIPLEIYIIAAIIIFCILANCAWAGLEGIFVGSMPGWPAAIATEIALVATLGWGLMLCMNIAHRIHGRIFWKYALCHRIWDKLKELAHLVRQNTPLLLKGAVIFAGISIIEFIVIAISWDSGNGVAFLLFWGWIKIIEFALTVVALIQMKALQKGSRDLAEGNLSQRMDIGKMFWEFRKHGENLNKIHQGMTIALDERMKSERFKTELITNVSHDIKTPLTSIINYVDLLQKEGLTEDDQTEYLEVLDRQSKRLKKLIEDLIEASKASTGNISVNLEPCNIDILLTQTVGEFQEKLSAASLELITNGTGKDIHIQADSRHLWRIFDNLMNNICKYAQPGTRVYISQEVSGNHISLIFRNTSKEALNISAEELMERFVRGDSSRNTEGNGLGLSIARSLTELMGGSFQIHVDGDLFKVTVRFSL